MNIFWLSYDMEESARYYCDRHVVKIPLEICQLLCTCHPKHISPYKHTHINHPLTRWVNRSISNYQLALEQGMYLLKEYTYRYNKHMKTEGVMEWLYNNPPNIPDIGVTYIPRCFSGYPIGETSDIVRDYRLYIIQAKKHLFHWRNRDKPYWINEFHTDNI